MKDVLKCCEKCQNLQILRITLNCSLQKCTMNATRFRLNERSFPNETHTKLTIPNEMNLFMGIHWSFNSFILNDCKRLHFSASWMSIFNPKKGMHSLNIHSNVSVSFKILCTIAFHLEWSIAKQSSIACVAVAVADVRTMYVWSANYTLKRLEYWKYAHMCWRHEWSRIRLNQQSEVVWPSTTSDVPRFCAIHLKIN